MSVLNLATATADTAIPESTGFTVVIGVIGVPLSLSYWFIFIKRFTHMVKTIMVGQEMYGHADEWGIRIWTMIREAVGHTKMSKKPGVVVAY